MYVHINYGGQMDAPLPLQNKGQPTSPSTPALTLASCSQSQYAELLARAGGEAGITAVPKQMKTKQPRPQRTGKWPFGF